MAEGRNPWRVDSIEDFYVLKCPECFFFTKQGNAVKNQATLSHTLFCESTIFDEHQFDVDPNEFDADLG